MDLACELGQLESVLLEGSELREHYLALLLVRGCRVTTDRPKVLQRELLPDSGALANELLLDFLGLLDANEKLQDELLLLLARRPQRQQPPPKTREEMLVACKQFLYGLFLRNEGCERIRVSPTEASFRSVATNLRALRDSVEAGPEGQSKTEWDFTDCLIDLNTSAKIKHIISLVRGERNQQVRIVLNGGAARSVPHFIFFDV